MAELAKFEFRKAINYNLSLILRAHAWQSKKMWDSAKIESGQSACPQSKNMCLVTEELWQIFAMILGFKVEYEP